MNMAIQRGPLLSTHDSLDESFATMVRAARVGDWVTCDEVGEMFAIALDVHLRHEEAVQFPRYEATRAGSAAEVQQFLAEHRQIRQAVGRLLASFRRRTVDFAVIGAVEVILHEHDANEAKHFLPWLTSFGYRLAHADSV